MSNTKEAGIYQLSNGYWGYRYGIVINGKTVWRKKTRTQNGEPIKTKTVAIRERNQSMTMLRATSANNGNKTTTTFSDVYSIYCKNGRHGKAFGTIRKQDSLWNNHISCDFGHICIQDITPSEINDYLCKLYYQDDYSYQYVASFLKMFYLLYGQAYSRGIIETDFYAKMCRNKDCRITMPKRKVNDEDDTVIFTKSEIEILDEYFNNTNAETAYYLGKYCGLRINECYGLKWDNIDIDNRTITIDRQMQYQDGLIRLVPVKTRNAKRTIIIPSALCNHLRKKKESLNNASTTIMKQRSQNQTIIEDIDGKKLSSLSLVNCLTNGKIQTNNSMKYHSRTLQKEYGLQFRYHYLRHTYGSTLANNNVPSHILRAQMGHSSINVTMKYYITITEEGQQSFKNKLDEMY